MLKVQAVVVALAVSFSVEAWAAVTISESFQSAPTDRGWGLYGDSSLFQWNEANENLEVRWDSRRTNSYFYLPLRTILSRSNDFALSFDLTLRDITPGIDPAKPFAMQVAVGFLNLSSASNTNFFRATGTDSPNIVEFNYFPNTGFGASVSPIVVSSNKQFAFAFTVFEMPIEQLFHIDMHYSAVQQALVTTVSSNGVSVAVTNQLDSSFSDFRVDVVSISSYSDAGQHPDFDGSILANGTVDNISITVPEPPVGAVTGGFANNVWQVTLTSEPGWTYSLERTSDFQNWTQVGSSVSGTGGTLTLQDSAPPATGFYRVRAEKP